VFTYKWTVNWRMVPEDVFLDRRFAATLLALHLLAVGAFAHRRWLYAAGGVPAAARRLLSGALPPRPALPPATVLRIALTSNFIGIVTARSLHYQFYSWYFHSLPLLLWLSGHPVVMAIVTLVIVELCWNVYPSTPASSGMLLVHHLGILYSLWTSDGGSEVVDSGNEVVLDKGIEEVLNSDSEAMDDGGNEKVLDRSMYAANLKPD
jgi:alpha-1,3-mannosyltransferase